MRNQMKLIGFKAYHDRDDDILEWWTSIPLGERSQVLRSLIRAFLSGDIITTPDGEAPTAHTRSLQLSQLQAETRWIRAALLDMPDFLEDLFGEMRQTLRRRPVAMTATDSEPAVSRQASEQVAQQRTTHVMQFDW